MGCLFLLSLLFIRWGWLWVLNTNEWIFGPTYDCLFWIINSVWKTSELSRKQLRSHHAGPVEDADGNARVQGTLVNVQCSAQGFLMFFSWMHLPSKNIPCVPVAPASSSVSPALLLKCSGETKHLASHQARVTGKSWKIPRRGSNICLIGSEK